MLITQAMRVNEGAFVSLARGARAVLGAAFSPQARSCLYSQLRFTVVVPLLLCGTWDGFTNRYSGKKGWGGVSCMGAPSFLRYV